MQMSKYDSSSWLEAKARIAEMIRDQLKPKKSRKKTHARVARYNESRKERDPWLAFEAADRQYLCAVLDPHIEKCGDGRVSWKP